jgi:hypothetical protein
MATTIKGILTNNSGFFNLASIYYSPIATIPTTGEYLSKIYCFLSQVEPWTNESDPPVPQEDQQYLKSVYKNMFVAKQITTNDMSPVIQRIDWTSGTVYDYYQDNVDMFTLDASGAITKFFYAKNRYDQVFKCLWNNNGGTSTVEPIFEPGTFNSNLIFQGADNYKWKYMYTITSGNKLKFMDINWMPVPVGQNIPNPVSNYAGVGSIDVINVGDGGSGYDPANATISVVITGDGQYATANASVNGSGVITDIVMANTGSNYSYANVSIVSLSGSGASANAQVSPIGGHGYDPVTELGARHLMMTCSFTKDESGNLPTDIDFRQVGVVVNPYAYTSATQFAIANASVYKTTTDFVVSTGFGSFIADETLFQSSNGSLSTATFSATVLSFDAVTNTVKLINTSGTAVDGALVYGSGSGTSRALLQQQTPTFIKDSGYITYLENRTAVQRSADGSEQFRLVLGY